jgi:pyruvate-ferredoxin/flavodoxin oxidoreductase
VNAFKEADSYPGVSLIIAYSHCIAHGYDLGDGIAQQERAVDAGYWPLFRYDPRRAAAGESPLKLDSAAPKIGLGEFVSHETRFRQVEAANPAVYQKLMEQAQRELKEKFSLYESMAAAMKPGAASAPVVPPKKP